MPERKRELEKKRKNDRSRYPRSWKKVKSHKHSLDSEETDDNWRSSRLSSKTLGRPSDSPVKREITESDDDMEEVSSSDVSMEDAPEERQDDETVKDGIFSRVEKAHKLKEFTATALVPSSKDLTVDIRVVIVATPTLCDFWHSKRSIDVTPQHVTSDITSLRYLKDAIDTILKSLGKRPRTTKPKYAKSYFTKKVFGKKKTRLRRHIRILTPGGLAVLQDRHHWDDHLQRAKENEGLFGDAQIFVCVGNGRLLSDGTVGEF